MAGAILSVLVPGLTLEDTRDIEIIKPTMRVDKVFRVRYRGEECILHVEFESASDPHILSRLLVYNAVLYHDYHLPVISLIIYPFRTTMAKSPLIITQGQEKLITFHFLTLPFFAMDAEQMVRDHVVCMYPMLPTMRGANQQVIEQAMDELAKLYREDEVTLSQQFVWMTLLLDRADTIPPQEKQEIRRRLTMYDPLWEENSRVKQDRAESRAKGIAEGLQEAVVTTVEVRFPPLTELAQQKVAQITKPDALKLLLKGISAAPDEAAARLLLELLAA